MKLACNYLALGVAVLVSPFGALLAQEFTSEASRVETSINTVTQSGSDPQRPVEVVPVLQADLPAPSLPPPPPPQPMSNIERAKQQMGEGQFAEALASAEAARRDAPGSYEATYYMAMANFGLERVQEAATLARQSFLLAPPQERATVQKLIDMIGDARAPQSSSTEADLALSEGRIAKAAELYEGLWSANKRETAHAMKAADLYAGRLSRFDKAGRLFNEVIQEAPESDAAQKAKGELQRLSKQLAETRASLYRASLTQAWPAAKESLEGAMGIEPGNERLAWVYYSRAVGASDLKSAQGALANLARRGPVEDGQLSAIPMTPAALTNVEFSGFVADVVGSGRRDGIARTAAAYEKAGRTNESLDLILQPLVASKKVMFFYGSQCNGTADCLLYATYPVKSIKVQNMCEIELQFGSPKHNDFTDVVPRRVISFENIKNFGGWDQIHSKLKKNPMVELTDPDNATNGRRGLLLPDKASQTVAWNWLYSRLQACGGTR